HCLHAMLVDTNTFEDAAEKRAEQEHQAKVHQHHLREGDVVDRNRSLAARKRKLEAEQRQHWPGEEGTVGTAADLRVMEQKEHHLPERQRHHEEEEATRPER